MARKALPKTDPLETIDPGGRYTIQLKRSVTIGPLTHRPAGPILMSGKLLQRIIDQEGRDVIVSADA